MKIVAHERCDVKALIATSNADYVVTPAFYSTLYTT